MGRWAGRGAMRQIRTEIQQAKSERKTIDQRIRRLRAAEAALYGRGPKPQRLNRTQLRDYLAEHPGSRSLEIADELGVPPSSVRTLLSTMKKDGEVTNEHQRWSLSHYEDTVG
jgi:DNA invertase Pin-like site-specific DNA recombinase